MSLPKPSISESPLSLATLERTLQSDNALNEKVQELITTGGSDLTQALAYLRNRDLQAAEEATRRKMLRMGRCPVCTLTLPCSHYKDKKELPPAVDLAGAESKSSVIVNITSGDSSLLSPTHRLTPSPNCRTELTARFRSPAGVAFRHKAKERSHSQNETRRGEERRLRLLEKLDRYRETRLRREIERLEEIRKREEEERRQENCREQKRQMRQQVLKSQLASYQERLLKQQEERKQQLLLNSLREKSDEKKRFAQMEKQKLLISDFHRKAQIIKSIQREHISDLGTTVSGSVPASRCSAVSPCGVASLPASVHTPRSCVTLESDALLRSSP